MHAAKLEKSPRLQRVAAFLADGLPHSTMEIIQEANVCAVNSVIAELRANGKTITTNVVGGTWFYTMEIDQ